MSKKVDTARKIFSFDHGAGIERWTAVNDNVMGGLSEGGASLAEDGRLVFSGSISLERNGGFASIRTLPADFNLSDCRGFRIRVKGDGRTYQFRIRVDDGYDGVAHKHDFLTEEDVWLDVDMPFAHFVPTYRGMTLQDVRPLEATEIRQLGFMMADKSAGPFKLTVAEIAAFR